MIEPGETSFRLNFKLASRQSGWMKPTSISRTSVGFTRPYESDPADAVGSDRS